MMYTRGGLDISPRSGRALRSLTLHFGQRYENSMLLPTWSLVGDGDGVGDEKTERCGNSISC